MKKRLPLIIFLFLIFLAAGVGTFFHFSNRTKFNEGYVSGNIPGNLYNEGLYCEKDGTVYFANPSDEDKLYSMRTDGGELTKLSDDIVSYINVDDNYIYYVRNNPGAGSSGGDFTFLSFNTDSLCRMNRDGNEDSILILDPEPSMYASLVGNYIYYLRYTEADGTSLYKVKIDGSEKQQVKEQPYFTCSVLGQYIYYNGLEQDHYIWRQNTVDDSVGMLYGGNCWMPILTDESTAYFMDCDNNYAIARADLDTGEKLILCEDRADWFNVYGNTIFFQHSDVKNPALCKINTDGSGYEVIAEGTYMNLNATSRYLYFRDYNSGQTLRVPIDGGDVMVFAPGIARE